MAYFRRHVSFSKGNLQTFVEPSNQNPWAFFSPGQPKFGQWDGVIEGGWGKRSLDTLRGTTCSSSKIWLTRVPFLKQTHHLKINPLKRRFLLETTILGAMLVSGRVVASGNMFYENLFDFSWTAGGFKSQCLNCWEKTLTKNQAIKALTKHQVIGSFG